MRAFRYAFDEALASLWRGRDSGLLSTATIALALFVLGGFLLVTANLERLGAQWSSTAELSVYLTDEATAADRQAIEVALAGSDAVSGREFVSKSDALARFKQTFGDLASAIDDPTDNPLPASFEAHLRPGPGAAASVDGLAATLRQLPGVADVRYDRQWLNRLLTGILTEVSSLDPAVLTGAALLILSAAVIACVTPALKAAHLDPVVALRNG